MAHIAACCELFCGWSVPLKIIHDHDFHSYARMSFDQLAKADDLSSVATKIPDSKLVLKNLSFKHDEIVANLESILIKNAINNNRFSFLPPDDDYFHHMSKFNDIDISLDTFPYNGTTTFESLFMGVPVLTITGVSHSSRVVTSILSNLGQNDLIAEDDNDFVRIAKYLANNPDRLSGQKTHLRSVLLHSELCNGKHFTGKLEKALLSII